MHFCCKHFFVAHMYSNKSLFGLKINICSQKNNGQTKELNNVEVTRFEILSLKWFDAYANGFFLYTKYYT